MSLSNISQDSYLCLSTNTSHHEVNCDLKNKSEVLKPFGINVLVKAK